MIDQANECEENAELARANELLIEALRVLDRHHHHAAAYVDHAIVKLGLRPTGDGMPEGDLGIAD